MATGTTIGSGGTHTYTLVGDEQDEPWIKFWISRFCRVGRVFFVMGFETHAFNHYERCQNRGLRSQSPILGDANRISKNANCEPLGSSRSLSRSFCTRRTTFPPVPSQERCDDSRHALAFLNLATRNFLSGSLRRLRVVCLCLHPTPNRLDIHNPCHWSPTWDSHHISEGAQTRKRLSFYSHLSSQCFISIHSVGDNDGGVFLHIVSAIIRQILAASCDGHEWCITAPHLSSQQKAQRDDFIAHDAGSNVPCHGQWVRHAKLLPGDAFPPPASSTTNDFATKGGRVSETGRQSSITATAPSFYHGPEQ